MEIEYKKQLIIDILVLVIVFFLSFLMFSRMINGVVTSDFLAHIESALNNEGYSIMALMIKICYSTLPNGLFLSIIMSFLIVLTVIAVSFLMENIIGDENVRHNNLIPLAATTIFSSKISLVGLSEKYYQHVMFATQPWHNSTYIMMRLIGVVVMIYFFLILKKGIKNMKLNNYVIFTLLLTFENLIKPNFIIGFAPALLVFLVIYFVKDRSNFIPCLKIGICVLLSLIVLPIQYKILYVAEGESSIAFSFKNAVDYIFVDKKFFLHFFLSFAFPFFLLFVEKERRITMKAKYMFLGCYV